MATARSLIRSLSKFSITAASITVAFVTTAPAADLARRTIERRAVEAVIWGMPAVNYDLMLQEMLTKTAGKVNEIIYWGGPLDWKNQTLTPNPDTLYFMSFLNTMDVGPIVIEVPPAGPQGSLNANIVNLWQQPLEDAGLLGVDKGKGVKLLMLPPGYSGQTPAGYEALQPDTHGSYVLFRSNMASHADADVAKSAAYAKQLKIYPLSQAANPPATVFTDVKDILFDSTIRYDDSFFLHLDRIVQSEPWLNRDRAMIDQLRSIGIEKGKPFAPDAATKEALAAGYGKRMPGWRQSSMPACPPSSRARTGHSPRTPICSRRQRTISTTQTLIRSIGAGSPITTPISASSGWVPVNSTLSTSRTKTAKATTGQRPTGCRCRRMCRSSSIGR
jgi:hypothetical protein